MQLIKLLTLGSIATCAFIKNQPINAAELAHLVGDPEVTHRVTFEVSHKKSTGNVVLGSLSIALFGTVVPKTATNFAELAAMTKGFGYENMIFHRIINHFMIQGGDYENRRGTGGKLIYEGGRFDDENFELKHDKLGRLSMANAGPNTNGAQFFITNVKKLEHLDDHHVVFGQLVGGFEELMQISKVEVDKDARPLEEVFVSKINVDYLKDVPKEATFVAEESSVSDKIAPEFEQPDPSSNLYVYLIMIAFIGGIGYAGYSGRRWLKARA